MTTFHSEEKGGGDAPNLSWQKDDEQVFRIYHLARHLWPMREELTPKANIPWEEWFKNHTDMTLDEFSVWSNKQKLKEKFANRKHMKTRLMVTQKEKLIGRE
tara:strand:+ start:400 stop:705 length:306 start_codon:yes stop_codon:yes gene_type:complete